MGKDMKRVSIVMCTYNGEKYLSPQLDSILKQTYPLHEVLIQDDGSTDRTCRIIEEYQRQYPFIRLIRNEKNLGYNINFLTAIMRASGDVIAISDQDDIWEENKLELLLETMETSNKEVCFCRSREFSDDNHIIPHWDPRRPNFGMERLIIGNMVSGHTLMITQSFAHLCTLELYRQTNGWYYDYFIVSLAAAYETLGFCDHVLIHYRRHADQVTAAHDRNKIKESGTLRTMCKAIYHYHAQKKEMIAFFTAKYQYFSSLPIRNFHLNNALKLARLFTRRNPISYLRLTRLCVHLRHEIFYTDEIPPLTLFFRSLFFPLYCGIYFQDSQIHPSKE